MSNNNYFIDAYRAAYKRCIASIDHLKIVKRIIIISIIAVIILGTILVFIYRHDFEKYTTHISSSYMQDMIKYYEKGYNRYAIGQLLLKSGLFAILPSMVIIAIFDALESWLYMLSVQNEEDISHILTIEKKYFS